jgi:hypothetical protein
MANDPVIETGPSDDLDALGSAIFRKPRVRDLDPRKFDARLREAVATGDENFVRARLGGDRILSDAEMALIVKTRREAEENFKQQAAAVQAVEKAEQLEEKEENFMQWMRRYLAQRAASPELNSIQPVVTRNGYLDANGCDPYGYKYHGDFGYDSQGNYKDSFGNTLGTDDVYRTSRGELDLRRGIYTSGKDAYNDQTGEVIIFSEEANGYIRMRPDGKGGMNPAEPGPDGTGKVMTAAERDQILEQWRMTNRAQSDAEMEQTRVRMQKVDQDRKNRVEGTSAEVGADGKPVNGSGGQEDLGAGVHGRADAGPNGNEALATEARATNAIETARNAYALRRGNAKDYRASNWNSQFQRRDALSKSVGDSSSDSYQEVSDAERAAFAEAAAKRQGGPKFALGEGSKKIDLGKGWVKDKDGGVWDDQGGYYDKQGGYWDKQGGYWDKDGNYTDQYGGFKSTDGSYMDAKGNYVDAQGNLWLANSTSDKPDFPKKEGVDYIDILAKASENRYGQITRDNPGVTADEAKDIETRLKKVESDFRAAKYTSDTTAQKSAFVATTAAVSTSAEQPATQPEPAAATRRTATPKVAM